ncbi:MAG: hypothetical protein COA54_04435 [Thiotrichaceae bacterium]|nr:MAG: hypothetical protein COA54_04435 [Thiotrichaceae bacterium]
MPSKKELDNMLIDSSSPEQSKQDIQKYLDKKQAAYDELEANATPVDRARLQLDVAEALVGMGRADESWEKARSALDTFIELEQWQDAVESCDVLYQSAQPASMVALAHGVWLSVTYPVDPTLTVNMLNYVIDETPANADGAAIAAITAHYIADARAESDQHKSLTFLTKQLLANVAKDHSGVEDQEGLSHWMERLELHDPDVFLPRLALVLGAIVPADDWWFDRDALREKIAE